MVIILVSNLIIFWRGSPTFVRVSLFILYFDLSPAYLMTTSPVTREGSGLNEGDPNVLVTFLSGDIIYSFS